MDKIVITIVICITIALVIGFIVFAFTVYNQMLLLNEVNKRLLTFSQDAIYAERDSYSNICTKNDNNTNEETEEHIDDSQIPYCDNI